MIFLYETVTSGAIFDTLLRKTPCEKIIGKEWDLKYTYVLGKLIPWRHFEIGRRSRTRYLMGLESHLASMSLQFRLKFPGP